VIAAGNRSCDTGNNKADHRTGDRVPEHSRLAAAGRRKQDDGQRHHHQQSAKRSPQVPGSWPGAHAHEQADRTAREVESPHRQRAVDRDGVKLVGDGSVQKGGHRAGCDTNNRTQ